MKVLFNVDGSKGSIYPKQTQTIFKMKYFLVHVILKNAGVSFCYMFENSHISTYLCKPTYFFKDFNYSILEREGGRKRGRAISTCGCLLRASNWGPGLQPRHVP